MVTLLRAINKKILPKLNFHKELYIYIDHRENKSRMILFCFIIKLPFEKKTFCWQ